MFSELWGEARYLRGWFDVYNEGLRNRDTPTQFQELFVWFFQSGQTLDGRVPSMVSDSDAAAVDDHMTRTGRIFIRWKLLDLEIDRSRPFTEIFRLRREPEPRVRLSRAGQLIGRRSEFWRDFAMLRRVCLAVAEHWFNRMRVPIAVANFLFLILKVSLSWNTMSAQIVGIVGAGLLLLASAARPFDGHHHH